MKAATFPLLVLLCAACSSLEITPNELRTEAGDDGARARSLVLWEESVAVANGFLASEHRQTLPPGQINLGDDGMTFSWTGVTPAMMYPEVNRPDTGEIPVVVSVVDFKGMARGSGRADAVGDGFVVKFRRGPLSDPIIENTFFRALDAPANYLTVEEHAYLLIYELAHVFFEVGTEQSDFVFFTSASVSFGDYGKGIDVPPGRTAAEFEGYVSGQPPMTPPEPPDLEAMQAEAEEQAKAEEPAKKRRYGFESGAVKSGG